MGPPRPQIRDIPEGEEARLISSGRTRSRVDDQMHHSDSDCRTFSLLSCKWDIWALRSAVSFRSVVKRRSVPPGGARLSLPATERKRPGPASRRAPTQPQQSGRGSVAGAGAGAGASRHVDSCPSNWRGPLRSHPLATEPPHETPSSARQALQPASLHRQGRPTAAGPAAAGGAREALAALVDHARRRPGFRHVGSGGEPL
jgi:hypothetical protein